MAEQGRVLLTTPRLLLRTYRDGDLPLYAALNCDPEVVRHLGGPLTRPQSDELVAWAHELHDAEGIGLLAVERREDGAFLGMCGLHHLDDWYPDDVEVAYRLARPYWGHGYATEAAFAWLAWGFEHLQPARVIGVSDLPNRASIVVMHHLGMAVDHHARLHDEESGETFDAVIHAVTAERWRAAAGSGPSDRDPAPCECLAAP